MHGYTDRNILSTTTTARTVYWYKFRPWAEVRRAEARQLRAALYAAQRQAKQR